MATIEDILNPFERNAYYYLDKNEYHIGVHPYIICNDLDYRIEEKEKRFLKTKCYIKFGEECSICYEPIYSKPNAFLTDCGHCFHKTCMSKWLISTFLEGSCPICRQDVGFFEFERYVSKKGLDGLEEFELNKNIRLPEYCCNDDDKLHIMGIDKNCPNCIIWRE
jgi:hypothetical protein